MQPHAAVDVGAHRLRHHEIVAGDQDAADRHRGPRVETGRGACFADVATGRGGTPAKASNCMAAFASSGKVDGSKISALTSCRVADVIVTMLPARWAKMPCVASALARRCVETAGFFIDCFQDVRKRTSQEAVSSLAAASTAKRARRIARLRCQ